MIMLLDINKSLHFNSDISVCVYTSKKLYIFFIICTMKQKKYI